MALIVKKDDTPRIVRNWPVVVPTSLDDGKIRKDEIFVDYVNLPQNEIDDLIESAREVGDNDAVALLKHVVKSISGMVDEENQPVAFNEETFAAALNRTNQRMAMLHSYYDVQNGRKAARKN